MSEDLLPALLLRDVDDQELLLVIEQHYGSARSTAEDEVIYPSADSYSLKIRTKDERVVSIQRGPAFSSRELELLQEKVRKQLVESPGTGVEACILFCSSPVTGSYRHASDRIQILAAPANAPRPNVVQAQHPFVLEFPTRRSHDGFMTNIRRGRGMLEWTWILNALLRRQITIIGPRVKLLWVACPDEADNVPTQAHIKWAQEFYVVDGFTSLRDGFSPHSTPEIARMPHDEYYGSSRLASDELVLPDSLSGMLDQIASLALDDRRRFIRAAQWVYVANAVWVHHMSSSYIALISAIESLADVPSVSKPCPTCGRDTSPGPTQRFQEFVERHAPASDASETNKKWLYRIRSDVAHGRYLLHLDEVPWWPSLSTTEVRHRDAFDQLYRTAKQVLVNWLRNATAVSAMPVETS